MAGEIFGDFKGVVVLELVCPKMNMGDVREGAPKKYFFSSLLLLRGLATPPSPLSSPVDNLDFRYIF